MLYPRGVPEQGVGVTHLSSASTYPRDLVAFGIQDFNSFSIVPIFVGHERLADSSTHVLGDVLVGTDTIPVEKN